MVFSRINHRLFLFTRNAEFLRVLRNKTFCTASTNILSSDAKEESGISEETPIIKRTSTSKRIPLNVEEYRELKHLEPHQPDDPHILKVSILGEPNVGKSTLTNALVKWKVCAVSSKVHTTRRKATAVFVEGNKQVIFLDTPGFVTPEMTKRHGLTASFVMDPITSIIDADLIAVVIDISNKYSNSRINENIIEVLETYKDKKSILIMNKVDAMKSKSRLLSLSRILTAGVVGGVEMSHYIEDDDLKNLSWNDTVRIATGNTEGQEEVIKEAKSLKLKDETRGWKSFSKVFMVSALKNNGMSDLRNYLLNETIPGEWQYHDSLVTDQHPHEIAQMIVREKLLEYLPAEIPYLLNVNVSKWEMLSTGSPKIEIKIECPNTRHKRFVIGPAGKHITACVEKSRKAMREAFRKDIVLKLAVVDTQK